MIAREREHVPRLLGCFHASKMQTAKPKFNINRFGANWNAFSGDKAKAHYFNTAPCSPVDITIIVARGRTSAAAADGLLFQQTLELFSV